MNQQQLRRRELHYHLKLYVGHELGAIGLGLGLG